MFVLIWASLLFAVRSNNAVASQDGSECSKNGSCISLSEGEITAEAGLCVVIPCSFNTDAGFTLENAVWYKCDPSKHDCTDLNITLHLNNTNPNAQSESRGQVSLLEPDLSQNNCSIIINDVTKSDSGSYHFIGGFLNETMERHTSPSVTITVTDLTQKPTVMIPPLTEGQQSTLSCTAPGLCSGSVPEISWTWGGAGEKDSHITGNITGFRTENVTAVTQRHSSTLTFNSSAEHHGTNVSCKVSFTNNITTEETVTLNVTYVKEVKITGETSVKEGETLNLTCSVESFPPSLITWTKLGLNKNLNNDTGTATLVIPNVTAESSGQYICTAKYQDNTLTKEVNITVKYYPKILNSSGCINQSEVLTCVCISEGFPVPTIKWPLLENHTRYSVITTVSHNTVNSTVTLTVRDHSNTSVECVSSNQNGEVKENLILKKVEEEDQNMSVNVLTMITRLEMIIAFLIGALLSAIICCLVRKCHRRKQRVYGNQAETLEMMTFNRDPLMDAGQAVEDYQAIDQVAAEAGRVVVADKSDVEYSKIDFSQIKRKTPTEAGTTQGTTETEYAEIKESKKMKEEAEETQEEEGEEEMIREAEETKHCVPEDKEGEDVALYSNVEDIMSQI